MNLTRRELGAITLLAGSAAAKAVAQTPTAVAAPPPTTATTRDWMEEARASHRDDSAALAKVDLPMSVEPAFEFRP